MHKYTISLNDTTKHERDQFAIDMLGGDERLDIGWETLQSMAMGLLKLRTKLNNCNMNKYEFKIMGFKIIYEG